MFHGGMLQAFESRCRLESELRAAIADGQIDVFFQPIVCLDSGETKSVEALARWRHPQLGFVPPDQFIALAEERNLIRDLGRHVLQRSCALARPWLDRGLIENFAVNLSPSQVQKPETIQDVVEALDAVKVAPSKLALEVTESLMLSESNAVNMVLNEIRSAGVGFALDDFGAGYSNLSYLKRLPIQKLKIDRSFVHGIDQQEPARVIIDGLTHLAHRLDLRVVVEGVETQRQCKLLQESGCDFAQGYLFSRPVCAEQLDALLHSWTPASRLR